jgi:hypothetical protein
VTFLYERSGLIIVLELLPKYSVRETFFSVFTRYTARTNMTNEKMGKKVKFNDFESKKIQKILVLSKISEKSL